MPSPIIQKCVNANSLDRQGKPFVSYTPNSFASKSVNDNHLMEAPSTTYWSVRLGNRLDDINYYNGLAPSGI